MSQIPRINISVIIAALALSLVVSACERDLSSGTYDEKQLGESDITSEGVIVSMRQVKVKPDASENSAGTLAGGALGGAGASAIGKGTGSLLSAIGGAIVGAIAGNVAEGELKKQTAMEYIVKIGSGNIKKKSGTYNESELRTVVQTPDPDFKIGTKVYLIESKKGRSRLISRN